MGLLWLLVRESARVVASRRRVCRRVAVLVSTAVRRTMVGVVPLALAAAGLVVLVILGELDRVWHAWSVIDLIALGAACVLAAACWRERRVYRILPFRNLVPAGAPAHDEVERIVSGFTVQLGLEIQRIMRLLEEDPLGEPTDVVSAEPKLGVTVQSTKSRVAFKTPITESGTRGDLPTTEVGTIEVGPLKLPIGVLLNLAARLVRRALRGEILESAERRHGSSGLLWPPWEKVDGTRGAADRLSAPRRRHRARVRVGPSHRVGHPWVLGRRCGRPELSAPGQRP